MVRSIEELLEYLYTDINPSQILTNLYNFNIFIYQHNLFD